ncbi:MAG: hypothetical protein ACKVP0_10625 [Pirellulaceae bacterium]
MLKFLGFYPGEHFKVVVPYVAGYFAVGVMLILWGGYDRLTTAKAAPDLDNEDGEEEDEEV